MTFCLFSEIIERISKIEEVEACDRFMSDNCSVYSLH